MGKAVKALSIVLVVASLFGLVGGGLSLKEALSSKAYWEGSSEDSIGALEDGLNQLKENEEAYLEGREALEAGKEAYAEGLKTLEDGQKQYDDGEKLLEEKQAEYDDGVQQLEAARVQLAQGKKKLEDGKAQYDAGAATLAQAQALQAGLAQINSGFTDPTSGWQAGYAGLQSLQSALGLPAPAASNASTYESAITSTIASIDTALAAYPYDYDTSKALQSQLQAALSGKPSKAELEAMLAAAGNPSLETLNSQKAALEGAIKSAKELDPEADVSAYETQLAQVNAGISAYEGIAAYNNLDTINSAISAMETRATLQSAVGVPTKVANGQQQLASGVATAVNGILGNEAMAAKLVGASGMTADQLKATVAALPSMDYPTFNATMTKLNTLAQGLMPELSATISDGEAKLAAAKEELDKGYTTYNNGLAKYRAGLKQLQEGAELLTEGKETLAEAGKQLTEGKAKLADAEKQLADGEAQLAVFENGRDQVIAGLDTAIGMEAYEGLESIADRLGPDFSYMKNDTDLDIDKGLEVVAAARAYQSDATEAVTKEITSKAIGAVVAIAGSVVALLGGVLGLLLKKPGFSGVVAILGGIAAVVGAVVSATAGSTFSQAAGASGPALLVAAEAVTAAAAVPQAISAFSAKAAAGAAETAV